MTRNLSISLFLILVSIITSLGQELPKYDPSILILEPYERIADKSTGREIAEISKELKKASLKYDKTDEEIENEIKNEAENVKIMVKNSYDYSVNTDFYSMLATISEQFMQYRFFEDFPNLLVLAKHEKSDGSITSLSALADKYSMQFVMNFKRVNSYNSDDGKVVEIDVQIYDAHQKATILENSYTGSEQNQGFSLTCNEGTMQCCVNNALKAMSYDVLGVIAENSRTLQLKNEMDKKRINTLFEVYYPMEVNALILPKISDTDTTINKSTYYHGIMNDEGDKFIGFFAEETNGLDFQYFKNKYGDRRFTMDESNFSDPPNIYCFVVSGIKYKDRWYYKKDEVQLFTSNSFEQGKLDYFMNLKEWSFFHENSDKVSEEFWESHFFNKVTDLKQDPDWDKYGKGIWAAEEKENRDYIGMCVIVADGLKKEMRLEYQQFNMEISEDVFIPFYREMADKDGNEFANYKKRENGLILIYPKDKSVILNGLIVMDYDGGENIRYFLYDVEAGSISEWTYFAENPIEMNTDREMWNYGTVIMDQLNTITKWNFSYNSLDDYEFWNNYVFVMMEGEFRYLKVLSRQ